MVNKTLSKELLKRAARKAAQKAVDEVCNNLLEKMDRYDRINRIIEVAIPRNYSGHSRQRIKDLVKSQVIERLIKDRRV